MRRVWRRTLAVLTLALLTAPLADPRADSRVARIGILSVDAPPPRDQELRSGTHFPLRAALSELGWIAGQNLVFERRYAAGQPDRLPALAAELVQLKVDLILTFRQPWARGCG